MSVLSKIKNWFIRHKPSKRRVIQVYTALLYNANLKGFIKGEIFTGSSKVSCVPGLNCYSCPGAIGSCPLGALQAAVAKSNKSITFYVIGTLLLYGIIFGRTICGWLCPVGLCQDLVYKINTPKLKKSKYTRLLSYLKYVILVVFVLILPIMYAQSGLPVPGFCKYFCPAGIFEGSFFILSSNTHLLPHLGPIFTWKFSLFIIIVIACIFIYRFFCRFICPLGAIYSLFNKFNILGVKVNKNTCIDCGLCIKECKMDIRKVGDHECINCGECIPVCPTNAIQWKGKKFVLPPNEIEVTNSEEKEIINNQSLEDNKTPEEPKKDYKKTLKLLTQIGATILLVGVLIYAYFGDQNKESSNSSHNSSLITNTTAIENEKCKNFEVKSINNKDDFSIEDSIGKFTVLNFWYRDCPGCIAELPYFEEFYRENEDSVNVIAINPKDTAELAITYISEMVSEGHEDLGVWIDWKLTFAMADKNDNLPDYFSIGNAYPATIFIGKDGNIKKMHYASLNKAELYAYYELYK